MDKNIPLSELIRIGSKLTNQSFGSLFGNNKTCALGAAIHAKTGELPENHSYTVKWNELPNLRLQVKHPPIKRLLSVKSCIIDLNDVFKWKREKIADWLESINL